MHMHRMRHVKWEVGEKASSRSWERNYFPLETGLFTKFYLFPRCIIKVVCGTFLWWVSVSWSSTLYQKQKEVYYHYKHAVSMKTDVSVLCGGVISTNGCKHNIWNSIYMWWQHKFSIGDIYYKRQPSLYLEQAYIKKMPLFLIPPVPQVNSNSNCPPCFAW